MAFCPGTTLSKDETSSKLSKHASTRIAIGIGGSVDSGKSSFVGVLFTGKLDNGNGSARESVAIHPHEIESGRTSAISTRYIHTSDHDAVVLVDLCGHDAYFGTTTFGASSHFLDYAFLIVSPNRGILKMTEQHIRLFISLNIPILVVITHVDNIPEHEYEKCQKSIVKVFAKYAGSKCLVEFVNDMKCKENIEIIKKKAVSSMTNSLGAFGQKPMSHVTSVFLYSIN